MYVIFPSNTPARSFPNNKSSSFSIPFHLTTPSEERWRVGLVHAQIPLTFYNVEAEESITVRLRDGSSFQLHPEEGIFTSPTRLAEMLTKGENRKYFELEWKPGFAIRLHTEVSGIRFSPRLARLMGLPTNLEGKQHFRSSTTHFDPWINHTVVMILCDLVRPVQFNEKHLPILQTLVLQQVEPGESYHHYPAPIDYMETQGDHHSSITFHITDVDGEPLKFRSGSVVLGLVFEHAGRGN